MIGEVSRTWPETRSPFPKRFWGRVARTPRPGGRKDTGKFRERDEKKNLEAMLEYSPPVPKSLLFTTRPV